MDVARTTTGHTSSFQPLSLLPVYLHAMTLLQYATSALAFILALFYLEYYLLEMDGQL